MTSASVLLCDDALFTRTILRGIVTAGGYEIVGEAENGRIGVEMFAQLRPDLVLMDMVMPEMGGLDAVRAIRVIDPNARIAMCSAMGQQMLVDEALEAGARSFITKPFNASRVLEVLADLTAPASR
jgi:two-component system chemotaxis response regulator CheY